MRSSLVGLAAVLATTLSCGSDEPGTWTMTEAKASLTADNHVVVDVVYVNKGESDYAGSRCIVVEWHRGTVQTQAEARLAPATPTEKLEALRFCNGGNAALEAGDRDLFKLVSASQREDLAGTTILVVAEELRNKPNDDRVTIPSP